MFYDPDDPDPDDIEYEEDEHVPFYERDYESKGSTKIRVTSSTTPSGSIFKTV